MASAAAARRFIADVLWQRGFSGTGIEDAVLLTSEVVTNAVLHAGTEVALVVTANETVARVEVHDHDPNPPVRRTVGPDATGGWGLHVVQSVADEWGVEPLPERGKCVWFQVRS